MKQNTIDRNIAIVVKDGFCSGCMLCGVICPVDAIAPDTDPYGFRVPSIDESVCVGCGACLNNCPMNVSKNCYRAV